VIEYWLVGLLLVVQSQNKKKVCVCVCVHICIYERNIAQFYTDVSDQHTQSIFSPFSPLNVLLIKHLFLLICLLYM
jgi:hypothetical protein